jgi:hypothetical protein
MAGLKSATDQMAKLVDLTGQVSRTTGELLNQAEGLQAQRQEIFSGRIGSGGGGGGGGGTFVIELRESDAQQRLLNRVDEQMRRLDRTIQESNALFGLRIRSQG